MDRPIMVVLLAAVAIVAVWVASGWGDALLGIAKPEKRQLAKKIGTGAVILFGVAGVVLLILVALR